MAERLFAKIPLGGITPQGFMGRLLRVQAEGLSGNIRNIWHDLSDNSAWLGGQGEAWERGPYYLDGLIPLSILLDDDILKQDMIKWIDHIIESQQESGFFGPKWNLDWWPRYVVLKALAPYYHATEDERIIPFMDKFLQYFYDNIDKNPPKFWASARALEITEAIELVHDKTGKAYLIDLCYKLKGYMYDWFGFFDELPYKEPMTAYMNRGIFNFFKNIGEPIDRLLKKIHRVKPPKPREKTLKFNNLKTVKTISMTHGVNIAMAIKYPVTYGKLTDNIDLYDLPLKGYGQLMKYHGTANGLWTSDEHLSGPDPSNGTELCTVAEMMYSLEEMLSITGNPVYADLLELMAYNTFPATFTSDMCCHQYVQQVNQIAADKRKRQFFDADSEANTYGLEPNFGCCAANMHQGFPKFAANSCYAAKDGLAFLVYMPCTVNTVIGGIDKRIVISEITDYPFKDSIRFEIKEGDAIDTCLSFRIPANTQGEIYYNGKSEGIFKQGIVKLKKVYNKGDVIEINLDAPVSIEYNSDGSISVRKGVLLFALKIKEKYINIRGKEPFNYRGFVFESDWNYAPILKDGKLEIIETIINDIEKQPFDSQQPPIILRVRGVRVLNWKEKRNSAGPYPEIPEISGPLVIELVPYGSTNIRTAQFPVIEGV